MAGRTLHHSLSLLILTLFAFSCSRNPTYNADPAYVKTLEKERRDKNTRYLTDGIIEDKDIKGFKGLYYFDPDSAYIVNAKLRRLPPLVFTFKTNTDRSPDYFTFGTLEFKIGDSVCHLIAYSHDREANEGLFIPFRDASSGKESYGGGRYIEMPYNGETEFIRIDFNRAFNPYCHYNAKYSCPLVPEENVLKVAITAGEKKFHD